MKKLLTIFASVLALSASPALSNDRIAVVELFTSQGCSSCPPADEFLGELAMRSDVLALAYHVDYWDYIGWKDIHARAEYTQRQRQYARQFRLRYVYTPQMVVSGDFETSGNDRRDIVKAVERQLGTDNGFSISASGQVAHLQGPSGSGPVDVYRVEYLKEVVTDVKRGENRGRTLTDYHIVADLEKIATWTDGQMEIKLPPAPQDTNRAVALFVQRPDNLSILTALKLN